MTLRLERHSKTFRCETREEAVELLRTEPWVEASILVVIWPGPEHFRVELTTNVWEAPLESPFTFPEPSAKLPDETPTE